MRLTPLLLLLAACSTTGPSAPVTVRVERVPITDPALLAFQWNCTVTWRATAASPSDTFWFKREWNGGGIANGVGIGSATFSSIAWLTQDHQLGIWWIVGTGSVIDGGTWRDTSQAALTNC